MVNESGARTNDSPIVWKNTKERQLVTWLKRLMGVRERQVMIRSRGVIAVDTFLSALA